MRSFLRVFRADMASEGLPARREKDSAVEDEQRRPLGKESTDVVYPLGAIRLKSEGQNVVACALLMA